MLDAFHIIDPSSYRDFKSLAEVVQFGKPEICQLVKHVRQGKQLFNLEVKQQKRHMIAQQAMKIFL